MAEAAREAADLTTAERAALARYGAELTMLRDFFRTWSDFHAIPRDHLHRNKQAKAAEAMVTAATTLRRYYKANPRETQVSTKPEIAHG